MSLQYVFGNPTKRRKKVVKKKNPRKTKVTAYSKSKVKTKSGKTVTRKKKVQSKTGPTVATKADIHKMSSLLSGVRAAIETGRIHKTNAKSKALKTSYARKIKSLQKKLKTLTDKVKKKKKARADEMKDIRTLVHDIKAAGMSAKKETKRWSVAKRKKAKKKSSRKRKTTRKKVTRKKTTRRKSAKKASSRKKTTRRRRKTGKKSISFLASTPKKKSRISVKVNPKNRRKKRRNPFGGVVMKRNNPMKVAGLQVAGYDPMELGELALGGVFYGAANSYISPMFAKIPGVGQYANALGGTLPTIVSGILTNIIAEKLGGNNAQVKKALNFVGDGLLGAGVVGLGVHLSQTLLPASLGGVDYIPSQSGALKDFGGVDYTPEMMGAVDFIPGENLPGQSDNTDFGGSAYEESSADFGEVPEGLQGLG